MSDQSRHSRRKQNEIADIGEIPRVVNSERRESCRFNLELFAATYFPFSTGLSPFSDDHKRVIQRIQGCMINGGRYANVVYRGFAKTTLSQVAAVWATLYGHRRFVAIFGADAGAGLGNIASIKMELSENELLYGDFPEVCHAIWALEGKPQRCASQTHVPGKVEGFQPSEDTLPQRTHIAWTADKIVFPTIMLADGPGVASGAIITCRGVTGGSRGMVHKRADGGQQRPDFVLLDDPQTDDSASTDLQVSKRENIIKKAILKLGGHNKQMGVVMNATPIQVDDLVERLLDQTRNPSWQSERIPMLRSFANDAAHEKLWLGDYKRIRNTYDKDTLGDQLRAHREATEFYRANRAAMDAGCAVSWEHCYDHEVEISAIQHAYNILIDDGEDVFQSECQCRPLTDTPDETETLAAAAICKKLNNIKRHVVPLECTKLTAFIDVQERLLYYTVCAWSGNFTGAVIDYGACPEQGTDRFYYRDAKRTLEKAFPAEGIEGRIHAGLELLTDTLLKKEWRREDGTIMRIERCLIDSGFKTDTVHQFCRNSKHATLLIASKGFAIRAKDKQFREWQDKPGETRGTNWVITPAGKGRRLAKFDTHYWKSFVYDRLAVAIGDKGCLSLFGTSREQHEYFAGHLTAEYRTLVEAKGNRVYEWDERPGKPDNHWLDCVVGCAAGASMQGCSVLPGGKAEPKKRIKLSELQAARRR